MEVIILPEARQAERRDASQTWIRAPEVYHGLVAALVQLQEDPRWSVPANRAAMLGKLEADIVTRLAPDPEMAAGIHHGIHGGTIAQAVLRSIDGRADATERRLLAPLTKVSV